MIKQKTYPIYIPYVNNQDVLEKCIASFGDIWPNIFVVDNSQTRDLVLANKEIPVYRPTVPLSLTQSWNLMTRESLSGAFFFAHSDCLASKEAYWKLVDWVNETLDKGTKWGVIFTHYDVFAAFNAEAMVDIGGADTMFHQYFADNDLYLRMELAGWKKLDSGIHVEHQNGGSNTVKSDHAQSQLVQSTFWLHQEYYKRKWGGLGGHEKFNIPFNGK